MFLDSLSLIQAILDLGLLACLALLILWLRRTPASPDGRKIYKSAEDFLAASEELAKAFDQNLQEKKALIQELNRGLEQRAGEMRQVLDEARQTLERLQTILAQPWPGQAAGPGTRPVLSEKELKVLQLHRDGLTPARIASQLRLPKGEVELILGLHRKR